MKKIAAFLLVLLVAALAFVSCGNKQTDESPAAAA